MTYAYVNTTQLVQSRHERVYDILPPALLHPSANAIAYSRMATGGSWSHTFLHDPFNDIHQEPLQGSATFQIPLHHDCFTDNCFVEILCDYAAASSLTAKPTEGESVLRAPRLHNSVDIIETSWSRACDPSWYYGATVFQATT